MSSSGEILPNDFPDAVNRVVFDEQMISRRVGELADEINKDYSGKDLAVVGILQGAYAFTRDLVRELTSPVSPDFMRISRYQKPFTGEVEIVEDLQQDITGRHVLLVEDIVDTGLSLNYLVQVLADRYPASLEVCALLNRSELRLVEIPIKYVGFQVSDEFLIGYGLDFRGGYRDLPFVATLNPHSVETTNLPVQTPQ
ncbi:MAG: hypoxanthine phosphoribosyltransferase [Acidobacteriota bacterium]|nr:hypoxanthine phosphoribosyltransferase [Acidobacteriota bacterium]